MSEIRPARAADAARLTGLLAQLGYPSEPDALTSRLAGILKSASQQILVAAPSGDSRIDRDSAAATTAETTLTGQA
ncbi:MAG: hypothetical protein J2P32_00135 [Actinobacteria bacterium]|nr:hypothetical protein [Actinomycetota bacterium]